MECTEDEATLRSEIQANRETTRVVRYKCFWAACQNSVHLTTSFFSICHPINLVTVCLTFQPSSQLNLSPFTPIFRLSTHELRTVSMCLFDCHPNWPPSAYNDGPNGVKGATEEDKNKARRAWSYGSDGSKSMGQRKGKPIPCIGPLQIEHYIN